MKKIALQGCFGASFVLFFHHPGHEPDRRLQPASTASRKASTANGPRSRMSTSAGSISSRTWCKTVQGAANFEKSTLEEVTQARAAAENSGVSTSAAPTDPNQLAAIISRPRNASGRRSSTSFPSPRIIHSFARRLISPSSRLSSRGPKTGSQSSVGGSTTPSSNTTPRFAHVPHASVRRRVRLFFQTLFLGEHGCRHSATGPIQFQQQQFPTDAVALRSS